MVRGKRITEVFVINHYPYTVSRTLAHRADYHPGIDADVVVADRMQDYAVSPVDYWSGDNKDKLRQFIAFAEDGAFWIEQPDAFQEAE